MASYVELAANRGERVGQMFGKAADAILGVEDAEAAVERVLMNGDWTTEEGKADMLAKVGAIDPDAHSELQKQLLEAEQTREATSNIKMNTENQLIAHKIKLNTGIYTRDWERLAGAGGMEFEIKYFLAQNEIDFDPKKVRTVGQARDAITRHLGKKNDSSMLSSLDSFLGGRLQTYINMRAAQDASAELGVTIDTSTEPNKFDIPIDVDAGTDVETKTSDIYLQSTDKKTNEMSEYHLTAAKNKANMEIINSLNKAWRSMVNMSGAGILEHYLSPEDLKKEQQEDEIQRWIRESGFRHFQALPKERLQEFNKNPLEYYNTYIAGDMFANFDY